MVQNKIISGKYGFKNSFKNWIEDFGAITLIVLVLFFGLFNVFSLFESEQAASLKDIMILFFLFLLTMFALNLLLAKDSLLRFFKQNKNLKGYYAISSLIGAFGLFLWIFSGFEGSTNQDIVYGVMTDSTFLLTYYSVVAFCETLIFAILLYNLVRHFAKADKVNVHFPSMLLTSVIFAGYHYIVYDGSIGALLFAILMNCFWIWMTWQQDNKYLSGTMITYASHWVFDLAWVGGIALAILKPLGLI